MSLFGPVYIYVCVCVCHVKDSIWLIFCMGVSKPLVLGLPFVALVESMLVTMGVFVSLFKQTEG